MKGNEKVIASLNGFLADELTAINQYIVHSEMCANWGYDKLHTKVEKRAIEEMKHAEKIIARILFLEGEAIKAYNDGIRLCLELGDNGTRELIDANLHDEEEHLDWLEAQLDQIAQMGLQNYLLGQAE